jgi:hypothetical protein
MTDRIIVQPGQCIDRATGVVIDFKTLPISPTEKVTATDPRWPQAVNQNCGDQSHTFTKTKDGTYQREEHE